MEYGLVALWWLAYVGLALFGLPVAARLFASIPGRGAGFSLTIALAVVTLVAFWVGHLALGWVALFAGLAALAACAVVAVRAGVAIDRRAAAEALVVFTLVYLFVLLLRSVDPGITPQGEKFLDFGLVTSLYHSASLPPEDFWFSGESVIYYYGGHFLASLLTRLTGTHPWYGFNLAMAGFYAMLASGAYELAGSVAVGRRVKESFRSVVSGLHGRTHVLAGATAVFFTICASNLSTTARVVVQNLPEIVRNDAAQALASVHAQFTPAQLLEPIPTQGYQYKAAGRIMPVTYEPFPLFAAIRGDMRPYFLSTPFLVVAIGLCYAYYRTPAESVTRRRALVFVAIPAVAGFMALINTWSLGVVGGLVWLTLTFAPADLRSLLPDRSLLSERLAARVPEVGQSVTETPRGALARTAGAAGLAVCVVILAILVALPFFLGPVRSRPDTPLVILAAEERSALGALLLVHGAFLAVFVTYLLARVRNRWTTSVAVAGALWFVALVLVVPESLAPFALLVPLLAGGWWFLTTGRAGFETLLVVAGCGLLLVPELGYIAEGGGSRFNTVVKTYMPTWILWACAAGVILPELVRGRKPWSWTDHRQQIGAVLAVTLLLSTAVFGGVALRSHFADPEAEEPTLDGLTAAEREIPGQVEAIRWLDNRSDRPNIVSAPGLRPYQWSASPAASLTGVPTVAGVEHEGQYRGRETYFNRVSEVDTIYLALDERRAALLEKYDVQYIYVGPTERSRYGDIRPFTELRGVRVAYQNQSVTVYGIDQNRLNTTNG